GVKRLIHISAIGAEKRARSQYARSKWAGENAVREQFAEAVILRPSLVFGPEDRLFNRFAELVRRVPLVPLIGGGTARVEPVYVGDVAAAIAAACAGKGAPGATYELGGPDVVTWRTLLDGVQAWSGRRRPYLRVPFALAKLAAIMTWPLPSAWRPLTLDTVRWLQGSLTVSEDALATGRTLAALGVVPAHAMAGIVPAYLERFQPHGQFAHYRG